MKLGLQGRTRQDSLVSRLNKLVGRTNFISFHILFLIRFVENIEQIELIDLIEKIRFNRKNPIYSIFSKKS